MLKRAGKYLPSVPLAIAVLVAGWLLTAPVGSDCQRYNTKSQQDTYSHCIEDSSAEAVAEYTKVLAALTMVLAVVGVSQIVYLVRADDAAANATRLTEQAMVSAQRAYLFAEGYKSYFEIIPNSKGYHWRFRPWWRNTGDTPPFDLQVYTECEVRNAPYPPGYKFVPSVKTFGIGVIIPKGTTQGGQAPLSPGSGITPQDIADVQSGNKHIMLWGWAKYYTAFDRKKRQITHFFYFCLPVGNGKIMKPDEMRWDYIQHTEGNYIAEE